jgi:hypothetical protein
MIPSVDDRLASVVRAITDVILPSLPAEAALAREQAQLAVGHLQILRGQLDAAPAFELEELSDARALGAALLAKGQGGPECSAALAALQAALDINDAKGLPRQRRTEIHAAIDGVIRHAAIDATPGFRQQLATVVIEMETARANKDRKLFAPMGFDAEAQS